MKYPAIGARLTGTTCTFSVWAPSLSSVEVVIDGISTPLERDDHGYWSAKVSPVHAGALYHYRLDGKKDLPDPASRSQPQGVHGPSAVVETSFNWTDGEWKGIPLGEMILYELHVGTFTPGNDFEGVIAKLPYLRELGVNAIELMPLASFPGSRNWGYDGVFPFAVQQSYGGPDGLKRLVDAAHRQGIAVVLDVVYNHQGPEGNYLEEYGPYFTDKYKTGWGQAINFDDAWCDGVRGFYLQNALMWLDEYRIDGLRLDAVHAIWDYSALPLMEELNSVVRRLEDQTGRKKVLIAEFDLNNPRYVLPVGRGGYGLDGQWVDEFHHALHALITDEHDGYYEDFGSADHLRRAIKDGYVYTGQYSQHRKKHFGRYPDGVNLDQFVVFAQNHDQVGNRMLGERLSALVSSEALKVAAAAYLLSPYVPMLFMGEEYGEKNPFQYFISHTDETLVKAVQEGRRKEFSYFDWQGDVPDPQDVATFNRCLLSWQIDDEGQSGQLLSFYRALIRLRKERPAFRGNTRDTIRMLDTPEKVVAFARIAGGDQVVVALNFNPAEATFQWPGDKPLKKILDSSTADWRGSDATGSGWRLNAESVSVFEIVD
jgi:maltooligosyltrehalose trehalohydrolase